MALLLLLLAGLGASPLFDVDEGAFSEATREMLTSGDVLHTTLNGLPRFDKPIGVYWLQALSVALLGVHEFAFRLPSALSTLGWCLAVFRFARPRWGDGVAWWSAALLASSAGVLVIGRAATADALLNLLLALAGLDVWRHLEQVSEPAAGRAPLRRAAAWIGMGLLVKGPVALLVPGAALIVWAAASRQWRPVWRALTDAPAWAWLLLIAVPWYAYALHRHGMAFVDGFLLRHNVDRFSTTLEGHGGNPAYYLLVLPLLWLPSSPLLFSVAWRIKALWAEPVTRYLLGWAGFVLVFFSLSGTQLPHYVLYGATPLVVLMARALDTAGRALRIALQTCLVLWWALLAFTPWVALQQAGRIAEPLYRALLQGAASPLPVAVGAGAAAVAVRVVWVLARRWSAPFAAVHCASAVLVAGFAVVVVGPWWGQAAQGPVRHAAAVAVQQGGPVVQWNLHMPSFAVYRGAPVPRAEPAVGELAFTRLDRLPANVPVEILFQERGLALVRRVVAPATASGEDNHAVPAR